VRGLPAEPAAPMAERVRALPYFVHNEVPVLRQSWIWLSRRKTVGESMRSELPQLRPDEPLPDAFRSSAAPLAVVVDSGGILLGAIDGNRPGAPACEAMNPAPQTIRPDMTPQLAATLLRESPYLLITTADGRYLGRYAGRG
jgi:hypothetical protein